MSFDTLVINCFYSLYFIYKAKINEKQLLSLEIKYNRDREITKANLKQTQNTVYLLVTTRLHYTYLRQKKLKHSSQNRYLLLASFQNTPRLISCAKINHSQNPQ